MNCPKTTNNDIVIMKDAKYLTNASRKNKNNKIWGNHEFTFAIKYLR